VKLARERCYIVLCVDFYISPLYEFSTAIEDAKNMLRVLLNSKYAEGAENFKALATSLKAVGAASSSKEPSAC
jgi:hypothetical protein